MAYLIGAGPGDLGLVTLRARELIERADVLIYDYLCNAEMLRWARPEARRIYVGKKAGEHTLRQEEINALLVAEVRAGHQVARLKGGDPYVFGRGGEEAEALFDAGLAFEEVPGVTSAIAAPAYAGIPVTHRDATSCVTFITGHEDPAKETSALDWPSLARLGGTKVFLMGVAHLREISAQLIAHGAAAATPAALVRWGTLPRQETLAGTLETIAGLAEQVKFQPPAVLVVGEVVSLRPKLAWAERRPLSGQRIVVTRTRQQPSAVSTSLRELGADVLEIPTIRIEPAPLPEGAAEQLRNVSSHFDWLLFTSPHGVEYFFQAFFAVCPDIRQLGPVRLAAVGPATAWALTERGLVVDRQPQPSTAEALAKTFTSSVTPGQRFALPRGNLADPFLADYLRSLGAEVTDWTLYQTVPETEDPTGARARYLAEGADWILFASASAVENWLALELSPPAGAPVPRIASIGPVTSAALRRRDQKVAVEASAPGVAGFVAALLSVAAGGGSQLPSPREL